MFKKLARVEIQKECRSTLTPYYRSTPTWIDGPTCSWPTWSQKIHIITRLPLTDLISTIYVFAHCFGTKAILHFFLPQHIFLGLLVDLERRSKTPSEICIETPVFLTFFCSLQFFLPYLFYSLYSDYCYVLFNYVWVVHLVRFTY